MSNKKNKVSSDTTIEELVELYPDAVTYLMEKGIRCIRCGEPIWGTLEDAAKEKGFSDDDIQVFVKDLNDIANQNPIKDEDAGKTKRKIDVEKIN